MTQLCHPREVWEEEWERLAPRGTSPACSLLDCSNHNFLTYLRIPWLWRWGAGLSSHLWNHYAAHLIPKPWGSLRMPVKEDPFRGSALCSPRPFAACLSVAHPQEPHHPAEKPVIHCHKCGEPCKGEVLRVQTKHFHIKCFTCKGMARSASRPGGTSQTVLALGSTSPPDSKQVAGW